MSAVEWPDVLGVWQISGYQYDQNIVLNRPDAKLGYSPGVRVRQKSPPEVVNAQLMLDRIQKLLFDWFFIRKIYHGALWFNAPVKRSGDIERHRLKIIDSPKSSFSQNHWRVTVKLELYE